MMWKNYRTSIFLTVLFMLSLVFHRITSAKTNRSCHMIYNGIDAQEGQFPWMVALYFKGEYCCSATLISDRSVLTAAHCIVINGIRQSIEDYHGSIGSINRTSGTRLEFEDVRIHPEYNFVEYDIAVLRTKERVDFNENIKPVCIAKKETKQKKYRMARAMGWGRSKTEPSFKDILQYTFLYVVRNSICSILQKTVTRSTLCTASIHKGVCDGDSGGPLIVDTDRNQPYVVGVASYINKVLGCGKLSMYSRISPSNEFVLGAFNDSLICRISD